MNERDYPSRSDEASRERTAFPAEPPAVPPEGVEAPEEWAEGEGFGEAVSHPRLRPTEPERDEEIGDDSGP